MRRRAPIALALLLPGLIWCAPAAGTPPVCLGQAPNVPIDSDSDGEPDLVCVSDFDGDAILEMDDIQDAVETLTDSGPKVVAVWSGAYQPPATPHTRPGRKKGLIELPSYTELFCDTDGAGVQLNGPGGTSQGDDYAVIANDDHEGGNTDLVIRNCEINGGAPSSFDGRGYFVTQRMGVYFRKTANSSVENCHVHHTYHTGLYTSNSSGDRFVNNLIEDVGGFGDAAPWFERIRYPGIYLYAFDGGVVDGFVASGNVMRRCGSGGLATRAQTTNEPGDVLRNILWVDNYVEDTGHATGYGNIRPPGSQACMMVRGVDGITVRNNECRSSGGLAFYGGATGYRDTGDDDASTNALIEGLTLTNVDGLAGIYVGPYSENVTLRNVSVNGTRDNDGNFVSLNCLHFETPLRGVEFEDLDLRDCGRAGILEGAQDGSGVLPGEELTFRRVTVENVDMANPIDSVGYPGLWFRGVHRGLILETVTANHATGPEIRFDSGLIDSLLTDIQIDSVDPGWLGSFSEAQIPACGPANEKRWIVTTDGQYLSDCDFSPDSSGNTSARCKCEAGQWSFLDPWTVQPGIVIREDGGPSSNVSLQDVIVSNARNLPGVWVNGEVTGFSVTNLIGVDDSAATDVNQDSALMLLHDLVDATLSGVQCIGTDPTKSCVEYQRDSADRDDDGHLNADDNCPMHANPDQKNTDGDALGDACDDDDDNDGLLDGVETNTGVFVDASNTGTDPLLADTDGDGVGDGDEVVAGTDPTDPFNVLPAIPALGPLEIGMLMLLLGAFGMIRLRRRGS